MNIHLKSFRCLREPKLTYEDICDVTDFNEIHEKSGAHIIISHSKNLFTQMVKQE